MTELKELYTKINGEWKRIQLFVSGETGNVFIQAMLYEDYKNIDEIAGHEVCTDEIIFDNAWFESTDDLREIYND